MLISVVSTVKNEERNIRDLLDSLVGQEGPLEILIVDADSSDRTREIVREYSGKYPIVRLLLQGGTRGEGRNFGVRNARGTAIAFIDGDCIANPFWVKGLREGMGDSKVVAGKILYKPEAIVYHRTRRSAYDFVRQAFWNGAGRKQLTLKHGGLWTRYRPVQMFRQQATFWSMVRLGAALMGYVGYKMFGRPREASR